MKRREFVQTAAVAAASLVALPSFVSAMKSKKAMGLQLYSLRDIIGLDPKGVLQKVASFGYKELEAYSYKDGKIFGMPYAEFGTFVKSLGMKVTSGHYGLDMLEGATWQQAVNDAKAIGMDYMVCPYINDKDRTSIDDYKKIIAK